MGLGDTTGLYHGTQQINQGQMDRWSIVSTLNYLPSEAEEEIVLSKVPNFKTKDGKETIKSMVSIAIETMDFIVSFPSLVLKLGTLDKTISSSASDGK